MKNYNYKVDIVICVHNALADVKKCIESIYQNTNDFGLILINDGSDKETSDYLRNVKSENLNINLIENVVAIGYTKSANIGLKSTNAEYVVLMNSDVIVTKNWLTKLIKCADSGNKIGLVGPVSNAASWQSVPYRFDNKGDWAINTIPANLTLDQFSELVEKCSNAEFPKVKLLNGVCILIKREVINKIGYLDEINFPKGYGEENDYCLRAGDADFELVIDDSTYIFHAKSKSFGHSTRNELSKKGNEKLIEKFGGERLKNATQELKENLTLKKLRNQLKKEILELKFISDKQNKVNTKITFLLPVAGIAGGIHSIFQEVMGMRELEVDAKIATWKSNYDSYRNAYPNVKNLEEHFFFFEDLDELILFCSTSDIVVATINHSMFLLKRIYDRYPNILPAYYIQDYEPFFFEKNSEDWRIAYDSYTLIPDALLFAKTNWLCETIKEIHSINVEKVSPSLDTLVYYPNLNYSESRTSVKIAAMIRPSTPRRGAERTMRVLKLIKEKYLNQVEINIFGTSQEHLNNYNIERNFDYTNYEIINREQVAELLKSSDIFIDFSIYQAFGRTGLEAMASGCAVIIPQKGGTSEYAINEQNALLVNTSNDEDCFNALDKLVSNNELRNKIKVNGIESASHYSIRRAAVSELLVFNKSLGIHNQRENKQLQKTFSDADKFYTEEGNFIYDFVSVITIIDKDTIIKKENLQSQINALRNNDEIILVTSNISSENELFVRSNIHNQNVKQIKCSANSKYNELLNEGIRQSKNPFLCIINTNIKIDKSIFRKLTVVLDKKHIVASAPLMNKSNTFQDISKYSSNGNFRDVETINGNLEKQYGNQIIISKTLTLDCLMLRKDAFQKVGRFDEYNSKEFMELDFIWNFKFFSHSLAIVPNSYCYWDESSASENKVKPFQIKEDKTKLFNKMKIHYGSDPILTPEQIWGIKNLNFDDVKDFESSVIRRLEKSKSVSIIILTYNSSKTISNCLASVDKYLTENDEVIIVDNCSEDNTVNIVNDFIKNKFQFKFIKNSKNIGFSAGTNVGIKEAKNQFIILLNPDTIVTKNWQQNLLNHFADEKIGAVGPISNYVAGLQKMELYVDAKFKNDESIEKAAEYFSNNNKGKSIETKLLIGFCVAVRKEILDKLGYLDENLFLGNDDLELSWRLRNNGYKLVVATDTFVFHEGQQSFNTKPKPITEKLVQESTDALYLKLLEYYGEGNIPTSEELWGMNWLKPSENLLNRNVNPKRTIIALTYNQLKYTKEFIESVQSNTSNYQLIIIDNNSSDGTKEYLTKLKKQHQNVNVIFNEENLGFPNAINQGILKAKGDYILVANNDIVVTKNWLNRMIAIAESDNKIGIVGPISNFVSGVQIDKNANYNSIGEMHKYAERISIENKNQIQEFPRIAFLCTLIKKEVIEKIGGLDERFTPGNFEDDDFCLRAQLAGYKTVIAKDVFIHHYGSVSFKANGVNQYSKRLKINKQKFIDKWGADPEEIWLKGKSYKNRNIKIPIYQDLFKQNIERAFQNIDENEIDLALENIIKSLDYFDQSDRIGYENISKEELLNIAGNLALSNNELEEAKNWFEKELEINPNSSAACFGLGEIFNKAEMFEESKTMLEWAVVNDIKNQNAKIKLEEVNQKLNLSVDHNSLLTENIFDKEI